MLKIISFVLLIYLIAGLFFYFKQRSLLYFPSDEAHTTLADPWWLSSGPHRLKLWKLNSGAPAIIYFGGNAESVEHNIANFSRLFSGFTVYLVNYRGYGGSSGEPSEQALYDDALTIYDAIRPQHPSISVIGLSLGSGVACHLAANRPVQKLALVTPYDSIESLAQTHYPVFPVKWFLKDRFNSLGLAPSIGSETLLVIAEHDRIVPRSHSLQLFQALDHVQPELVEVPAANHNNIRDSALYQDRLQAFFQQGQ